MSQYRLRPVVLDHRKGLIVHYGPFTELEAHDVPAAQIEVDRLPLGSGINCLQILDAHGSVVTHRMLNPENGNDEWNTPRLGRRRTETASGTNPTRSHAHVLNYTDAGRPNLEQCRPAMRLVGVGWTARSSRRPLPPIPSRLCVRRDRRPNMRVENGRPRSPSGSREGP